jgi:hypothetical protein
MVKGTPAYQLGESFNMESHDSCDTAGTPLLL